MSNQSFSQSRPLYDPRRALEHIQTLPGFTPRRLFAILFPLWNIEINAMQEEGRPYELLERYIERGVMEAQLHSAKELADFFGLQAGLVIKVLSFLEGLGHLRNNHGYWELTSLGERSYQEGTNYVPMEKRINLYFDMFQLHPLLSEHYDRKKVRVIPSEELATAQKMGAGGTRFRPISSLEPWQALALTQLMHRPDREKFNFPSKIHDIHVTKVEQAFLPMYIIECGRAATSHQAHGRRLAAPYYLVFTGVKNLRDEYLEQIINTVPAIHDALESEKGFQPAALWLEWLREKGIDGVIPMEREDGIWQVELPPAVFSGRHPKFPPAMIGDYELRQGYFMQIWCDDSYQRRYAVLDRALRVIRSQQKHIKLHNVQEQMQLLARQLKTRVFDISDLQRRARETDQEEVAALLDDLVSARKV